MRYALVLAGALMAATPAGAATCSVSAVTLAFGNYSTLKAAHTDTAGNIAITCTGKAGESVVYGIALSAGRGTFPVRRMNSAAGALLNYNLYTNAARTVVWGDTSSGTLVVSDAYTLATPSTTRNYPVYGRMFASQKTPVGTYSDAIVVTLHF